MASRNVCRQQLRLLQQQPNTFYFRRFRSLSTAFKSSWKSSQDNISTSGLCTVRRCASSGSAGSYDYVIVGAGSAGCVLANKLILGDRDATVLLTESGPPHDRDMLIAMPGACRYTTMNPKYDWCYETVPQVCWNAQRAVVIFYQLAFSSLSQRTRAVNNFTPFKSCSTLSLFCVSPRKIPGLGPLLILTNSNCAI
jgi:GMC oxidoreductase